MDHLIKTLIFSPKMKSVTLNSFQMHTSENRSYKVLQTLTICLVPSSTRKIFLIFWLNISYWLGSLSYLLVIRSKYSHMETSQYLFLKSISHLKAKQTQCTRFKRCTLVFRIGLEKPSKICALPPQFCRHYCSFKTPKFSLTFSHLKYFHIEPVLILLHDCSSIAANKSKEIQNLGSCFYLLQFTQTAWYTAHVIEQTYLKAGLNLNFPPLIWISRKEYLW